MSTYANKTSFTIKSYGFVDSEGWENQEDLKGPKRIAFSHYKKNWTVKSSSKSCRNYNKEFYRPVRLAHVPSLSFVVETL